MVKGKHLGQQVSIRVTDDEKNSLTQWANHEHRTVTNLVLSLVREGLKTRKISTSDDLEQVAEFVKLLLGERERANLSFVEVGEILGINPDKLAELYLLLADCKEKMSHE